MLEVHGGTEGVGGPAGEMPCEGLLEGAEIAAAARIARSGGAEFGVGDEGEGLRLALAEAMGFEAEGYRGAARWRRSCGRGSYRRTRGEADSGRGRR